MSLAKVLRLDEYRDRRSQRLGLCRAFSGRDPLRAALIDHLVEVAERTGADRVAIVWVDEYGPGLVHPHVVLDLLADRPRRIFAADPLHTAWDDGIPGTVDRTGGGEAGAASAFAVALGSDGSRGWFLLADSVGRRPPLGEVARERVMFLAGECSAVVLHRDLAGGGEAPFAGWNHLVDLDGREGDQELEARLRHRFAVGRLVRGFLEEEGCVPDERRAELSARLRQELDSLPDPTEAELLDEVLEAYAVGDTERLGAAMLALGEDAERLDQAQGALESYSCAFELAAIVADAELAVNAARYSGRVSRRRARWEEADAWYGIAVEIARLAGLGGLAALSLSGLGVTKRERGNVPAARARFEEARRVAEGAGDTEALANVHHDLMGLEYTAGDFHEALRHGWRAVNGYGSDVHRTRCMAGMAGVLLELGDWGAAEDAFTVVARTSDEHYYLIYAHDALAHIAALRGDAAGFESRAEACDRLGWEQGPLSAKAEILKFRGLSHIALGRHREARRWLERAIRFADEHRFSRTLFEAQSALDALTEGRAVTKEEVPLPAPPEVREGLRALRLEVAGSAP